MILNRKISSRRKSQIKLNQKRNSRISRKNQKGGNYFLAVNQPRIGGLAEVSYVDDVYAQSAPNMHLSNVDPNVKLSCNKGGFRSNKQNNRKNNNLKGGNCNFSADMNTRKFDCYQPNWSADCV